MSAMPLDLVSAISERARDPQRRTYMAGTQATALALDIDALLGDFRQHVPQQAQGLLGAFEHLSGMLDGLGKGATLMGPGGAFSLGGDGPSGSRVLAQPPGDTAIALAEARIGRTFPEELRQLYAIADGGFGPGEGLFTLAELVDRHFELTSAPFGPMGQEWPANLLPLFDENPVLVCLDLDSGEVVAWDPEDIEDEESEADWQRSFKREQASLAELMGDWLERPTFGEAAEDPIQAAMRQWTDREQRPSPVTGLPMQLDDPAGQAEAEIRFLTYSDADMRRSYGLPEVGWEDEVRRRHGLI
ncbi:MAG: SMI1/KNR4 family protein [Novosphingobium sp.]